MNGKKYLVSTAVLLSALASEGSLAALSLPAPDCGTAAGKNCLVFDDMTVYSLSFLQFNENGDLSPGPGDKFYVPSSPGMIMDDIVVASSPNSARPNTDVVTSGEADDAFRTPNASTNTLFTMHENLEPTPNGWTGDDVYKSSTLLPNPNNLNIDQSSGGDGNSNGKLSLWDIQIDDLLTFLMGGDLVFFFNLNETGAENQLGGQDMLAWAQVHLSDTTNTNATKTYTLSGNNTASAAQKQTQTAGTDNILPTVNDLWAFVHGRICVDSTNGATLALTSCSAAGNPANGQTVNQNLGANAAAFGVYNEDLTNDLYSGDYDVMSVDLRMARINDGYEQLFIRVANVEGTDFEPVPEPGMVWLLSAGLLGMVWRRRQANVS